MRLTVRSGWQFASTAASVAALGTIGMVTGCMASNTSTATPSATVAPAVMSSSATAAAVQPGVRYVVAGTPEQAGEYLTIVGGCNDCHTERWAESNGNVPQADRLAGNPVGYRGPWGTTYAANLRMLTQRMPEDRWVTMLQTAAGGHGMPPMPWMNTRMMSDQDLRAMYRYIHSLGPKGVRMPRQVPPGQEPTTPYIDMSTRSAGR